MERVAKFCANHAKDHPFKREGLRDYFEYRDLGIKEATGGRYHAHLARAIRGSDEPIGGRHFHDCDIQMIFFTKGWLKAEYDGIGVVEFTAGSCLHNPPGNPHLVLSFSDDLEFLELTSPADYGTVDA
jgi:mannose-6-phosphate isomerase-like protein (cupin superfamily)